MNGSRLLILLLVSYCSHILSRSMPTKTKPGILIVSYDGFKPDYLNWNITPNLQQFREMGTSAEFMKPVFPTKTFVNHFTIATGLYPENHGVFGNGMYDSELHRQLKYSYELFHYNENVVPIWTANELAGGHTGCMMWIGANFQYKGKNCTFTMAFNNNISFEERVDTVMSWFTHAETPANLVMLYAEQPDGDAHEFGPDSVQVMEKVSVFDKLTGYIQRKLVENHLENSINVVHLSDHGMARVTKSNLIDLAQFLNEKTYKMYGSSPVMQIVPTDHDIEHEIFLNLTKAAQQNGHFKVYNQWNLPSRWHANNTRRMGPIIAVAHINYGFQYFTNNLLFSNTTVRGIHGYDNEDPEMRAFFMAKGPLIAKGKRLSAVNNIDLYNLFCRILKIECGENDGSKNLNIWNELFVNESNDDNEHSNYIPYHS